MNKLPLNGSDQLMRGFDFELRRNGFAGNHCQIVLELAAPVSAETISKRLNALQAAQPMLGARVSKWFRPQWQIPDRTAKSIPIRTHRDDPALRQKLFNEPLRIHRGELLRVDLIECAGGRMDLIFSWAHTLMDATAAEFLLAAISDEKLVLPATPPQPPAAPPKWPERLVLMRTSVAQLDKFCENQPRALRTRHKGAPRELRYRVERFNADETARIRANSARLCGVLGDAQFHAVSAALELHRLHQKLGHATKSYIVPMPVGLRPKGKLEPLFSNQVDMLMLQFFPEQLDRFETAITALKAQAMQGMREGSVSFGRKLSELFSFLPLPIYMAVLKHGLKGEICSVFFGDPGTVTPKLENFLGVPVLKFTHAAAVTPSPGVGVIFYYFRGDLQVSVIYAATVLNDTEAADFAAAIRQRLLNP